MDLEGFNLSDIEKELLCHPATAGVILFKRNFANLEQLCELVNAIRATTRGKELLIATDQEGGRVQRLTSPFTKLPAPGVIAERTTDQNAARLMCHEVGWLMASELNAAGIDISFAPVLDVDIGVSEVIGLRSFGDHADTVIELATAYIAGMNEAGMAATGKHFPGHGGIKADSHITSPIDSRNFEQLYLSELRVFEALIQTGISGIMPSHVVYSKINSKPPCFSEFWLQNILRKEYHFDGCIFSDDLSMQGAVVIGSVSERAEIALDAGCDALLCCNEQKSVIEIIDNVSVSDCHDRARRISAMSQNSEYNPKVEALAQIQATNRYRQLTQKLAQLEN